MKHKINAQQFRLQALNAELAMGSLVARVEADAKARGDTVTRVGPDCIVVPTDRPEAAAADLRKVMEAAPYYGTMTGSWRP